LRCAESACFFRNGGSLFGCRSWLYGTHNGEKNGKAPNELRPDYRLGFSRFQIYSAEHLFSDVDISDFLQRKEPAKIGLSRNQYVILVAAPPR